MGSVREFIWREKRNDTFILISNRRKKQVSFWSIVAANTKSTEP